MNIQLIRESFEAIKPHAAEVIEHFYEELFDRYPVSKTLFKEVKMEQQRRALVNSLAHIVEYIEDGEHLTDYLRKMGQRHNAYGTKAEHYSWIGEALLATFAYYFGEQWTPELASSWISAYEFISREMQIGMKKGKPKSEAQNKPTPSLSELTQTVAKNMLKQAIQAELETEEFKTYLRKSVQDAIRKTIELESAEMLTDTRPHIRSA